MPRNELNQVDAARRAKQLFPELADYEGLFRNTGIETPYTCEPSEWYEREHGWEERTELFLRHALDLLQGSGRRRDRCRQGRAQGYRRHRRQHYYRPYRASMPS